MDRKTFTIVLAIALIVCFFLAYWANYSGFDFVKASGAGWDRYILLLIPISGLLLLIGAMTGNYIMGRNLWAWLPLLVVLFLIIIKPLIDGIAFGDIFKNIGKGYGIGLWITIFAALFLALYNPRRRAI